MSCAIVNTDKVIAFEVGLCSIELTITYDQSRYELSKDDLTIEAGCSNEKTGTYQSSEQSEARSG